MLTKLGKYEIRRELGRGAMGIVYEGFDPFIERTVAIKTIQKTLIDKSDVQEVFNRFRREAQAAGRLTHPNIVSVYEYGEEGDMAFIAMEFITGKELKEHFDASSKFQIHGIVNIMTQLLDALEYSHARGVVHRDIKPANILITRDGKVKIADFGIAKIEASDLTQVGTVLGTPSYMSPEQFMGVAVDRRSDIYSAGVILYQFLTGERPFTGSNMSIIMHKVLNEAPISPRKLDSNIPANLDAAVMKAIAKRPEDRFQTAAEFMKALRSEVVSNAPPARVTALDATLKITTPQHSPQKIGLRQDTSIDFSMEDFEKRLKETQSGVRASAMPARNADTQRGDNVPMPTVNFVPAPSGHEQGHESGLLASLASEAKKKLGTQQSEALNIQAQAQRVNGALGRIINFFTPFIQHVNNVAPTISRSYRLDTKTVYTNLKWKDATVDFRKQSLSDSALLDYVTFSVNLCAPGPVLLRRPLGQVDMLKKELHHLRLRAIDDLDSLSQRPNQEWLQANLAPDFPLQIRFQGNYAKGCIDVLGRNVEAFGTVSLKLDPVDVTPKFMDEIGLFLLGRVDKLPAVLRRA